MHFNDLDIPNEKSVDGNALPFKDRAEDFALVKKANYKETPVSPKLEEAQLEDPSKNLPSEAILSMGDETLADLDVGDLDSAFANLSEVSSFIYLFKQQTLSP